MFHHLRNGQLSSKVVYHFTFQPAVYENLYSMGNLLVLAFKAFSSLAPTTPAVSPPLTLLLVLHSPAMLASRFQHLMFLPPSNGCLFPAHFTSIALDPLELLLHSTHNNFNSTRNYTKISRIDNTKHWQGWEQMEHTHG